MRNLKIFLSLISLMLLLTSCKNQLDELVPLEQFPDFILQDMDVSVVNHLEELSESVTQNESNDEESRFSTWLNLAHALHGYELYDAAEMAYKNALLFDIRSSEVSYQLAHLYKLQSNYQLSNPLFISVTEQTKDYAPAYNNLAENLNDQGSLEAAKTAIKKSLELDENNAYALQILANINAQLSDSEAAINDLKKALELQPQATKLYLNLAQLYQLQGQQEAASDARAKGGEGKLTTIDPWLSEVTKDVRGYNQFITKAKSNLDRGDFKSALKWADLAASDRPDTFTVHMMLGVIKVRLNQLNPALLHFRQAQQLNPNDFNVNLNLGTTYSKLGKHAESISHFQKALEIDSGHLVAKLNLADVYCANKQFNESMKLTNELLPTSMQQNALYVGLRCQIQQKKFRLAYQWIQDHIASAGSNDAFIEFAILVLATSPHEDQRDGQIALNWLEKLMSKQKTNKRNQLLILALMELNRFDEAQKVFNSLRATRDLYISKKAMQYLLNNKMPYIMSEY